MWQTANDSRLTRSATPIFAPSAATIEASQLTAFIRFCAQLTGRSLADSRELYQLSVDELELFWQLFLSFSGLAWSGEASPVCTNECVETASFFPNLQLNYAENLLRCETPADLDHPAITGRNGTGVTEKLTRGELRLRVAELAALLRELEVNPGERIVSVLRNDVGSVVAALGSATVGAVFSSASPEMGVPGLLSRFGQLNPSLLIVSSISTRGLSIQRLEELARGLPSLKGVVVLEDCPIPSGFPIPIHCSYKLRAGLQPEQWTRFPFNHPLFIMFSSGTTGLPKCILHGAGGTLLEHMKEQMLHEDLRPNDKLFFHTSTAWMMWNWQLSALACGAEIVLYDGSVVDPEVLWKIVAEEQVTIFGTSPPFLRMCQSAGYSPSGLKLDLTSLRSIISTGAILYEGQFHWCREHVGAIPVQSISGGTDILGCFFLGNPNLPVYPGGLQCRSLGLDVRTLVPENAPDGTAGDLICAKPFPSRPLGLYGDSSGERFHAAYFSQHPGVWTQGDLVEIMPDGSARMHGRSDGVLNVRGIRIGPAEIYHIMSSFAEVRESIVVEQGTPGELSDSRMVLLVVMNDGHVLDPPLRARIRTALARQASPAHVPAVIVDVTELPLTHNGKQSEIAARETLNGHRAGNSGALRNPNCLEAIATRVAEHDARATRAAPGTSSVGSLEEELTDIWERVLGTSPIRPHDNFFEAGGTSLLTAPLFQQIADRLGRRLPLSTILHAPTISSLAGLLRDDREETWGSLELLKTGDAQRPLFIAPGLLGEPLGMRGLAENIATTRAVYGLRGQGLLDGEQPLERVEDMAHAHLRSLRALQPRGPYSLLGFSLGGAVVFEMARHLVNAGECVEFLGLIDTHLGWACLRRCERIAQTIQLPFRWPHALTLDLRRNLRLFRNERRGLHGATGLPRSQHGVRVVAASQRALANYRPGPFAGHVVYFQASVLHPLQYDSAAAWSRLASNLTVQRVPGHHEELIRARVVELARAVTENLAHATEREGERNDLASSRPPEPSADGRRPGFAW